MATSQFVTYQHTDAMIVYQPRVDVEPAEGWRMECDEEIASRLSRPQYKLLDCIGASRRLTTRRGASLSFTIFGASKISAFPDPRTNDVETCPHLVVQIDRVNLLADNLSPYPATQIFGLPINHLIFITAFDHHHV